MATQRVLKSDRPPRAHFQNGDVPSPDAEFAEESVVVSKPDDVAEAGACVRPLEVFDLCDDNHRSATLHKVPSRGAEGESGDEVDVDRRETQVVAEPAVDTGPNVKAVCDG